MNIANNSTEAIEILNNYEKMIRTYHKQIIQCKFKQGEIFKKLKDIENFFNGSGQNRSTVYLKTVIHKIL